MRLRQDGCETAFGTCDIWGVVGRGLDSVTGGAIASAYGDYLCPDQPGHSLVGHDNGLKLCQQYAPSLGGQNCLSEMLGHASERSSSGPMNDDNDWGRDRRDSGAPRPRRVTRC